MEVPDKIYISPNIENRTWLFGKADTTSVEYIRKDALLEWAKETYLNENASDIRKVCHKQLIDKLNTM